jgi:alkylation response protein AidB-like acyl-CoA dehydrogenase
MSTADELLEIRALAREFAAAELRPHTERWDADRALADDVPGKIAELGFFGMLVPEACGGMEFSLPTYTAALEELAWGEPAAALLVAQSVIAADLIAAHGSAAQRAAWLPPLAAGEQLAAIAFSEDPPVSGATPLATRATRLAGAWSLDGRKRWVANGDRAAVLLLLAAVEQRPALFVAPRSSGYRVGDAAPTMGLRAVSLVDIDLTGVSLPDEHLLTELDAPSRPDTGVVGTLSGAAIAVGIAQAALEHAVAYAAEREQFGVPIRSFEGIQNKLAEMATRTATARTMTEWAAARPEDAAAAAMAKLSAAAGAMFVTTEAVQIFGGYGYMRDYPVEKLMRDAKATEIMHGSSELQRLRIARALYS